MKPTEKQLEKINSFARREMSADEIYVFSAILCDNEIDRDYEQFPKASLEKLANLFIGMSGIFDNRANAENQAARMFETQIIEEAREISIGEPYCYLKAWAYMVRCDKNADLILEIDAGIKKEVSIGCAVERVVCSICDEDMKHGKCEHKKGEKYFGEICRHILENPTDAFEWSFVAVPAQKSR